MARPTSEARGAATRKIPSERFGDSSGEKWTPKPFSERRTPRPTMARFEVARTRPLGLAISVLLRSSEHALPQCAVHGVADPEACWLTNPQRALMPGRPQAVKVTAALATYDLAKWAADQDDPALESARWQLPRGVVLVGMALAAWSFGHRRPLAGPSGAWPLVLGKVRLTLPFSR